MNGRLTTCATACGAVTLSLAAPGPSTAQLDDGLPVHAPTVQVLEAGALTLEPDDHRWITVRFDGREATRYQASQRDGQVCVEAVEFQILGDRCCDHYGSLLCFQKLRQFPPHVLHARTLIAGENNQP